MTTIATLEDIVARIGVEVMELAKSQKEGLEASRAEADRRRAEADKRRAEDDRRRAEDDKRRAEADRAFAASRAEADKRRAEADKRRAEDDKRRAEADRAFAASRAEDDKRRAEADRRRAEADKRMEELDRQIDKVSKQIGGINENIGYHAEQFFQDTIAETMTFGGEKYDKIVNNFKHKKNDMEIDVLLINGKSVAIIEVKNRIHPNFVQELATEKIAKFRKLFPEYQNHRAYLGIAGFSFCEAVMDDAKKLGVGIIKQVGDSVEIDAGHLKAY